MGIEAVGKVESMIVEEVVGVGITCATRISRDLSVGRALATTFKNGRMRESFSSLS